MTIHVVQPGETIFSIAAAYGVDPGRLASDNLVSGGLLAVGQTLVIRIPAATHIVAAGETLYDISRTYNISLRQLWRQNWFLGGQDHVLPGQTLVLSYQDTPLGSVVSNSYAYPFIEESLLNQQLPYLSSFAPFTYGITRDNALLPLEDDSLMAAARKRGALPVMHLSTLTESGTFSTERAIPILSDETIQSDLISQILQTLLTHGYAGLDVDFEYLPGSIASLYAIFLSRLHRILQPMGKFLWAALAPKTSARQPGLLYEGHDYRAVGASVDGVLLMTYEWGYTAGPPMAVAPLPNVRQVLDYAVTELPREKIFLGIPNYGYDWSLPFVSGETRARSISNQQAIDLAIRYQVAIQYDETAQAPYFHYTDEAGIIHEVWFEDARSLDVKLRLIAEYGFQGTGIWNLMRPFSQIWLLLDSLYHIL